MSDKVNSIDRIVGLNILLNRMAFGMELRELAEKLDIEEELLSQIEEGQVRTGVNFLIKVSKVFDIPVTKLLISMQQKSDHMDQDHILISQIHELLNSFTKMKSDESRNRILELAKSLANA